MKEARDEKGVTLLELTITITVLLILASVTTQLGLGKTMELKRYNSVKSDIIELTEAVQTYYMAKGELPLEDADTQVEFTPPEDNKNPNDIGEYYEIDISLLESVNIQNKRNTYLVDKQSLTVYCQEGVEYQSKTYYTILDNNETTDYYNQVDLPIISIVTFESNNSINKYWATEGDIVTLKLFTNYEISPTVKINGTNVNIDWSEDRRTGTATYKVGEIKTPDTKIEFSISNYTANGKEGETINKPTFSDGVTLKMNTWEIMKVSLNTEAIGNGTINGGTPNTNNPIIPRGYIPINAGSATWGDGSSAPEQSSVDNGLVIKDSKGNEWVWVPVELVTLEKMYVTSNSGIALSGDLGVSTKVYTNTTTVGRTGDTRTMERGLPNTTSKREPDVIATYDKTEAYYKTILEFDTTKAMAEAFSIDYSNMINSIKKYGGFYIGRYELSIEGVQKGKATLTNVNWYNLYKKCIEVNTSNKIESRMIWGVQWDLTCDFISRRGEKKSITNSSAWGNHNDSMGNAAVMNGTTKMYGNKQVTGFSEYWKANNIYDFAGNVWEWTQEAENTYCRLIRGGGYGNNVSGYSVADYFSANVTSNNIARRNTTNFNNKLIKIKIILENNKTDCYNKRETKNNKPFYYFLKIYT